MMRSSAIAASVVALLVGGCATSDDATDNSSPPSVTVAVSPEPDPSVPGAASTVPAPASTVPASSVPASTSTIAPPTGPPARIEIADDADADEFAARLSGAHATMIDVSAPAGDREQAGIEYQLVLRALSDRVDLDEAVVAALDPSARPAVERIIRARQFLQARTASRPPQPLPDELPAWTIAEPEPVDTLLAHYAEAEQLTGIAWYWLAAIHLQETRMGRIEGISSAGAVGPMQFLPTTWSECCVGDPTVTRDAIIGAATYLMQSGGPEDMAAAVYQYNPNDGYVAVVTAYAESFRDEHELYTGHHAFQVFFGASVGTVRLPIGYSEAAPIDAAAYLAAHPNDAA
jgi:membrane-bound lytic murein transglycosylase B